LHGSMESEANTRTGNVSQQARFEWINKWNARSGLGVSISLLLFDIGWLMEIPSLFLLGVALGLILQLFCTMVSWYHHSSFCCGMQAAMLLWVIGNSCWAGSEFIWPPVGFLEDLPFIAKLPKAANAPIMMASCFILVASAFVLTVAYLLPLFQRCRTSGAQSGMTIASVGRAPFIAATSVSMRDGSHQDASLEEAHSHRNKWFARWLEIEAKATSHEWYRSLYVLPFVLADTAWCVGNLFQVIGSSSVAMWALEVFIVTSGAVSVSLGFRIVYNDATQRMHCSAIMLGSDVLWVLGNVVWACQDVLPSGFEGDFTEIVVDDVCLGIFIVSSIGFLISLCLTNDEGRPSVAGAHSILATPRHSRLGSLANHSHVNYRDGSTL